MGEFKYEIGFDYAYLDVIPDIPIGSWVEIIWACGSRYRMKHTEGNKACWKPRIYDPAIKSFCVIEYFDDASSNGEIK